MWIRNRCFLAPWRTFFLLLSKFFFLRCTPPRWTNDASSKWGRIKESPPEVSLCLFRSLQEAIKSLFSYDKHDDEMGQIMFLLIFVMPEVKKSFFPIWSSSCCMSSHREKVFCPDSCGMLNAHSPSSTPYSLGHLGSFSQGCFATPLTCFALICPLWQDHHKTGFV